MQAVSIASALQGLSESLGRIRAHLEWIHLKESERRRGDPPVFITNPDLATALRNEEGLFLKTASEIRDVLNSGETQGLSDDKKAQWRSKLVRLGAELHRLNLPKAL